MSATDLHVSPAAVSAAAGGPAPADRRRAAGCRSLSARHDAPAAMTVAGGLAGDGAAANRPVGRLLSGVVCAGLSGSVSGSGRFPAGHGGAAGRSAATARVRPRAYERRPGLPEFDPDPMPATGGPDRMEVV